MSCTPYNAERGMANRHSFAIYCTMYLLSEAEYILPYMTEDIAPRGIQQRHERRVLSFRSTQHEADYHPNHRCLQRLQSTDWAGSVMNLKQTYVVPWLWDGAVRSHEG